MSFRILLASFFLLPLCLLQGCDSPYEKCIKKLERDEGSGVGQMRRIFACGKEEGAPNPFK